MTQIKIKLIRKISVILLFVFVLILTVPIAYAQSANVNPATSIGLYLANIISNYVVPAASIAALVVITFAGIQYMTSQGTPDSLTKAKELILGAILGLTLIFLMGYLLGIIIPSEELDTNTFDLPEAATSTTAPATNNTNNPNVNTGGGTSGGGSNPQAGQFALSSPAFGDNQTIPRQYTNTTPPLTISNIPKNTANLTLTVTDENAGNLVHLNLIVKPTSTQVPPTTLNIPLSPPAGSTHKYIFKITALDKLGKSFGQSQISGLYSN